MGGERLTSFAGLDRYRSTVQADANLVESCYLDSVVFPSDEVFNQIISLILRWQQQQHQKMIGLNQTQ